MPREDTTGPLGKGPRTGRGLGRCANGQASDPAEDRSYGGRAGDRRFFGRGGARGPGGGRGLRNRFFATGVPFNATVDGTAGRTLDREDEVPLLEQESQRLKSALETVEKRLRALKSK